MEQSNGQTGFLGGSVTPQETQVTSNKPVAKPKNNSLCRSWCYTLFDYKDSHIETLKSLDCRRHVCGCEETKEGKPHLQGYIRFEKPQRLSFLKKYMPKAHLEPRRGSEKQAADYCKKEGNVIIDVGIDSDDRQAYSSVGEETDAVIEEIEADEPFGAIRNRHKRFTFNHRHKILDYMHDHKKLKITPDYDPNWGRA